MQAAKPRSKPHAKPTGDARAPAAGLSLTEMLQKGKRRLDPRDRPSSPPQKQQRTAGKTNARDGEMGEAVFELSAKRRVTVRAWKGAALVDVREFYDDRGTAKPGKKGISLSPDQWRTLVNRAGDVSGAIEIVEEDRVDDQDAVAKLGDCIVGVDAGEDRAIAFNLSAKRRVTVRFFRTAVLVDIREYYEQDSVTKPGRKGISLSKAQWLALEELTSDISEAASKL